MSRIGTSATWITRHSIRSTRSRVARFRDSHWSLLLRKSRTATTKTSTRPMTRLMPFRRHTNGSKTTTTPNPSPSPIIPTTPEQLARGFCKLSITCPKPNLLIRWGKSLRANSRIIKRIERWGQSICLTTFLFCCSSSAGCLSWFTPKPYQEAGTAGYRHCLTTWAHTLKINSKPTIETTSAFSQQKRS